MKYLILGSCVTRDAFEFNDFLRRELSGYCARTSMATLSPNNLIINRSFNSSSYDTKLQNLSSKFQNRMVKSDFENGVLTIINENIYDRIVIDLIDERFNLGVVDGRLITASSEFYLTKIRTNEIIDSFSEEWYQLWCQGTELLLDCLLQKGRLGDVLINRVYWAHMQEDGDIVDPNKFSPQLISRYNYKMQRMYGFLEGYLEKEQFIQFDESILRADSGHKWGLAPFHYCSAYYAELVHRLLNN